RESVALNEVTQPLEQASERGADLIVTPCPLCHLSLDAWQSKAKKQAGKDYSMPTLHMSQLIALAAGIDGSELKFQRHVTPVGKKIQDAVVR
ncbi:MAG: heterodisulfide reductase-related iron-sulfur binding cluster, partial [Gaiellales bacterium]